jgi:1-acyl-sn-glycerol-3-phosphate acyltransferase
MGAETGDGRPRVDLPNDTALDYAISGALWGAGLAWLGSMMGTLIVLHRVVGPRRVQWLERLYCRGQLALTGTRWRAVVDPAIDPAVPYVFMQNHTNHLDHCAMYCATTHFKQGVELAAHFDYPVYGRFMRGRGTIPIQTDSPTRLRELMRRMREELAQGGSLLVFPEGTRTLDGRVGPFHAGVFRIVQQIGAPIVPVTVTGMYRVMRKGSYLIRPGHEVTTYCDRPIATAGMTRRDVPDLMARVRAAMNERLDAYWRENVR